MSRGVVKGSDDLTENISGNVCFCLAEVCENQERAIAVLTLAILKIAAFTPDPMKTLADVSDYFDQQESRDVVEIAHMQNEEDGRLLEPKVYQSTLN